MYGCCNSSLHSPCIAAAQRAGRVVVETLHEGAEVHTGVVCPPCRASSAGWCDGEGVRGGGPVLLTRAVQPWCVDIHLHPPPSPRLHPCAQPLHIHPPPPSLSSIPSSISLGAADEPLLTQETMAHVQQLVAAHGSDIWWTAPIEQLLPPSLAHLAPKLRKGEDTMDVWFDSGSSWAGVVQAGADRGLGFPADLYLEGSDQHRGE